jgi:hypothetical protein
MLLLVAGSVLVLIEGVYLAAYGTASPYSYPSPLGLVLPTTPVAGVLSAIGGAIGLALGALVVARPDYHTLVGAGSLTIGLLTVYAGGGFLIGSTLLYVGGLLALYYEPQPVSVAEAELPEEPLDEDPVVEADIIATKTRPR